MWHPCRRRKNETVQQSKGKEAEGNIATYRQSGRRRGRRDYAATLCACMPVREDQGMAQQRQRTLQNVRIVRHF